MRPTSSAGALAMFTKHAAFLTAMLTPIASMASVERVRSHTQPEMGSHEPLAGAQISFLPRQACARQEHYRPFS